MQVEPTRVSDVVVITPDRIKDNRGFFSESWNARALADFGITTEFVQDNQSLSVATGTLRGLHYQSPPFAQAKLVRCGRGAVFDVAVDVRMGSPTFGVWVGVDLTAENGRQLFIPDGCLHGFITRTPDTEVLYKCSSHYDSSADGSVAWDSCGIDWNITAPPVLSEKDANAPAFSDFRSPFTYRSAA